MDLELSKVDQHGRSQYRLGTSNKTTVRFGSSFFNGEPPKTIQVVADGIAEPAAPKAKLTAEERAALPKPTLQQQAELAAQRAQKAQERAQRLAARATAAANAPAEGAPAEGAAPRGRGRKAA